MGAQIADAATAFGADVVLKVQAPTDAEIPLLKRGAVLIGMLEPFNTGQAAKFAAAGITAFALEAAPRTTRAQSPDVLSSQASIAGYKAVFLDVYRARLMRKYDTGNATELLQRLLGH